MKIPSTKRVLLVGYPIAAAIFGAIGWAAVNWGIPDEPHPELYGAVTAGSLLVYMYIRTWFDVRKARRERAKV